MIADRTDLAVLKPFRIGDAEPWRFGVWHGAALVAALFAGHAIPAHHSHWKAALEIVALGLFGVTAVAVLYIEVPREFVFAYDLEPWIADIKNQRRIILEDVAYNLGGALEQYRTQNAPMVAKLTNVYVGVCALVALQVVIWGAVAV